MSKIELLTDRAVIRLGGEDRRSFLQGLITQDVERLAPGGAVFATLLTPQGKILFDFFITAADDAFLIDCEKDAAPALVKRLTLYKLRAKVTIDIDETLSVLASENEIEDPDGFAFPDPRLPALGWRSISRDAPAEEDGGYEQRRLRCGVPKFGQDFGSDEMFLTDVNYDVLNAVSYRKGCFVGQEVSSRMKRKGEIRKRTVIAEFEGAPPAKGAAVTAGESTIGEILSGAERRALALVRLDRWENAKSSGATIEAEGRKLRLSVPDYLKQH